MIKKRENKFLSFIVIIIVVIFVGAIYIVISSGNLYQNISNSQPTSNQIYKSKAMKFSIDVPSKFQIKEDLSIFLLKYNGLNIEIIKNGTNYSNLNDYIVSFDQRRNLISSEVKKNSVNGLEAMSRKVRFPKEKGEQKTYYICGDNWVYILSTSSPALFNDLDKIARSFRYTP